MRNRRASTASLVNANTFYLGDHRSGSAPRNRSTVPASAWTPTSHELRETFAWKPYNPPPSKPAAMEAAPELLSTMSATTQRLHDPRQRRGIEFGATLNMSQGSAFSPPEDGTSQTAWQYQTTPALMSSLRFVISTKHMWSSRSGTNMAVAYLIISAFVCAIVRR